MLGLAIILQSCCEERFIITSNGEMSAWEVTEYQERNPIDTIRGEFILEIHFMEQLVFNSKNISLIKTASATSCVQTYLNEILPNSMELTIDKEWIYDGDTLSQNFNLLSLDTSAIELDSYYGYLSVSFKENFFSKASIDAGLCAFQFNAETDDNIELTTDKELYVNFTN